MGAKKLYRSKMAANGQLVLPKELRDALGLAGGDVLIIQAEDQGDGLIEVTIQRPRTSFRGLIGQWAGKKGAKSVGVDDWSDDLKRLDDEEMK
jgi:AbrB family looped-hinge helix DNA binding protein